MNLSAPLPPPPQRFKIGEVAAVSGISVKTIRYYEDIGLLAPTVFRAESGYRLFAPAVWERLAFIKQAQSLGLSLQEVKEILQVHDQGHLPCEAVKQHLEAKIQEMTAKIQSLRAQRSHLQTILAAWNEHPAPPAAAIICPNLQSNAVTFQSP